MIDIIVAITLLTEINSKRSRTVLSTGRGVTKQLLLLSVCLILQYWAVSRNGRSQAIHLDVSLVTV